MLTLLLFSLSFFLMSPGSVRPLLKPEAMAKNHPKEQLGQTIEVPVTMSDVTLPFSALICTKNFSRDGVTNSVLAESTSTKNSVKNILFFHLHRVLSLKFNLIFSRMRSLMVLLPSRS